MLKLLGNHAAVMHVAKGPLRSKYPQLQLLQAAIAVLAGLPQAQWVREGDVLRIVAALHDELTQHGLLSRPAQDIVESFITRAVYDSMQRNRKTPEPATLLREALLSNIVLTRIRTEDGLRLVEWEDALPVGFEAAVVALLEVGAEAPLAEAV